MNSRESPVSFNKGSQWSEKGSETRRDPLIQLWTSQKTTPSVNRSPGGALVSTIGL
jgi:hypothetical protein